MKAAVYHGRRDVRIEEVPEPARPEAHEVELEISRAAICGTDASEYAHGPQAIPIERRHAGSGHLGPVVLGHEMVGRIVSVGSGVELSLGQRVVPGAGVWCGTCEWCAAGRTNLCERYYTIGLQAHGGLANRVTVPATMCKPVPEAVEDDLAAIAQPLAVALHAVDRGEPEAGETAVLIGVGGIGNFALGALVRSQPGTLVAIDIDDERLAHAKRAGATHVVNVSREDPWDLVAEVSGGEGAHLVVETSGVRSSPGLAARLVQRGGRIVVVGLQAAPVEIDLADLVLREVNLLTTVAHVCDSDIPLALDLLADPNFASSAIDRVIPLDAVVEEGLEPLLAGAVQGKIVVDPQ